MGASILSIVLVALLGGFVGQSSLNTHARNLTAAMNDATRVMEQIRAQNVRGRGTCAINPPYPTAEPPGRPYTGWALINWNTWFNRGGAGTPKSINLRNRNLLEVVVVTCQNEDGTAYCGPNQTGQHEWRPWFNGGVPPGGTQVAPTTFDPLRVTVSVGWRQQQRIMGGGASGSEFTYSAGQVRVGPDTGGVGGLIDSQAMVTSLVTCR